MKWLQTNNWKIICFDFPQSGTGAILHQNQNLRHGKSKSSIIPDIIAFKDKKVVLLENKDRFVLNDLIKLNNIRTLNSYSESFSKLLNNYDYNVIRYGIGIPLSETNISRIAEHSDKIDFAILCDPTGKITVNFDPNHLF